MAKIIVVNGRVGVSNGRLATDANGAPCCCGGAPSLYQRYEDCCSARRHAWFNVAHVACPGVINVRGRCWRPIGAPITKAEILANYPGEPIYEDSGAVCASGCNDPACPPCNDCCYRINEDPTCTYCNCLRGPCTCGRRWHVGWSTFDYGTQYYYGEVLVNDYRRSGSGQLVWRYTEDAQGVCDLVLESCTGQVRVIQRIGIESGNPTVSDHTYQVDANDPTQPGWGTFTGCGQYLGILLECVQQTGGGGQAFDGNNTLICGDFGQCAFDDGKACDYQCFRPCIPAEDKCGIDYKVSRAQACSGSFFDLDYRGTYTDGVCSTQGTATERYRFDVSTVTRCADGTGIVGSLPPPGGSPAPPPAGSFF